MRVIFLDRFMRSPNDNPLELVHARCSRCAFTEWGSREQLDAAGWTVQFPSYSTSCASAFDVYYGCPRCDSMALVAFVPEESGFKRLPAEKIVDRRIPCA